MQEQFNEKISLLIDDELETVKALSLMKIIRNDEALKLRLQRYQLIGQVLKNENCYLFDSDFAEQIHRQIVNEPVFFIPRKKAGKNWRNAGLALAASIILAVVWIADKNNRQIHSSPEPELAYALPQQNQSGPASVRLNDYLQAHDNSVYINNVARPVQPYARVAGFQQE